MKTIFLTMAMLVAASSAFADTLDCKIQSFDGNNTSRTGLSDTQELKQELTNGSAQLSLYNQAGDRTVTASTANNLVIISVKTDAGNTNAMGDGTAQISDVRSNLLITVSCSIQK